MNNTYATFSQALQAGSSAANNSLRTASNFLNSAAANFGDSASLAFKIDAFLAEQEAKKKQEIEAKESRLADLEKQRLDALYKTFDMQGEMRKQTWKEKQDEFANKIDLQNLNLSKFKAEQQKIESDRDYQRNLVKDRFNQELDIRKLGLKEKELYLKNKELGIRYATKSQEINKNLMQEDVKNRTIAMLRDDSIPIDKKIKELSDLRQLGYIDNKQYKEIQAAYPGISSYLESKDELAKNAATAYVKAPSKVFSEKALGFLGNIQNANISKDVLNFKDMFRNSGLKISNQLSDAITEEADKYETSSMADLTDYIPFLRSEDSPLIEAAWFGENELKPDVWLKNLARDKDMANILVDAGMSKKDIYAISNDKKLPEKVNKNNLASKAVLNLIKYADNKAAKGEQLSPFLKKKVFEAGILYQNIENKMKEEKPNKNKRTNKNFWK